MRENSASEARAAVDKSLVDAVTELNKALGIEPQTPSQRTDQQSSWIEIANQAEVKVLKEGLIWVTEKKRFDSFPKVNDIIYLFFKPELICVASYRIDELNSQEDLKISFKITEVSVFPNPLNLNTLNLHSDITSEIKDLYKKVSIDGIKNE